MFNELATTRKIWQVLGVAGAIAISLATMSAALAGECPADKMKPNARQMVDYKPVCTENPIRVDDVMESPKLAE